MELNFDNERAVLQQTRAELLARVAVIDSALTALGGDVGRPTKAKGGKGDDPVPVRAGRKPMSAKAKKAARDRMLAYWAAKRAAAKPKARPGR